MADSPLPIETRYADCRFRSRLEARWAVFFDHMHVRWEYEPEGYTLPNGELYLPDFFLPDLDVSGMAKGLFFEVKPDRREDLAWDPPHSLPKCSGLATPDIPLLLAVGSPSECTGFLFAPETGVASDECDGLCLDGWAAGGCLLMPLFNGYVGLLGAQGTPKYCHCHLWQAGATAGEARDSFGEACRAFTSARFEHGESG